MNIKELETNLKTALTSKNEYETISITDNIQIWVQKDNKNTCVELQARVNNNEDFGDTNINLTIFKDSLSILAQNIIHYMQAFDKLDFCEFVERYCD